MHLDQRREERAHIDRRELGPRELGVESRGPRDFAYQAVEARDVILDHGGQLLALRALADLVQRLDGASERAQRVPDLVHNIGRESLDGVEPLIQRRGHVAKGVAEMADFIAPGGEIGDGDAPAVTVAHFLGGGGEASYRPRDGARQIDRQQHGDRQGHREHLKDRQPHAAHAGFDIGGTAHQHQGAVDPFVALTGSATLKITAPSGASRSARVASPPKAANASS